jgi:hypothetical protein
MQKVHNDKRFDKTSSHDLQVAAELLKKIGSGKFSSRDVAMASILGPQLEKRKTVS